MHAPNMTSKTDNNTTTKCDIGFDCTVCFIYFQGSIIYLALIIIALIMTCRDNAILRKRVLRKTNSKGLTHTIESVIPTTHKIERPVSWNDLPNLDIEDGN